MIIKCPFCIKQFKIDSSLIPIEGRDLKCGSCDQVWFYKIENNNSNQIPLNEDVTSKDIHSNIAEDKIEEKINNNEDVLKKKIVKNAENFEEKIAPLITEKNKENTNNNFFLIWLYLLYHL